MTMKKWVDKQKINLITCVNRPGGRSDAIRNEEGDDGVWKMYVSQYKNYRLRGVS